MCAWKTMIALIAALALAVALAACDDDDNGDAVRGSGNVVSEEMAFSDFTAVDLSNAFEAEITHSDSFKVTIRVDDNLLDLIDVSQAGDTLTIGVQSGVILRGDVTLEANITMPDLSGLELSGASRAGVSGFRSSGRISIDASGASRVDGDLEAGSADMEASGASRITLDGSAAEITANGSGASTLDLADFVVDTAEVTLSGASQATVNVQDRLDPVTLSGASRLRYVGDPNLGDVNTSGASTLEKES
jgi:hypothetical protein